MRSLSRFLVYSSQVESALALHRPLVALESTIISHGMPYPQNIEMALAVEAIVLENGAVPATICLADGRVHIGMERSLIETLGRAGRDVRKTSRRDFASVLHSKGLGATTVSGTMIAAHAAGISVFATGGIGGVHRGAENTFDVSADLTELGKTPVAVVCGGVKSLLDIPKTLEYLETQGVPVVTLGSDTFPAFYSQGGVPTPERMDSVAEVGSLWRASLDFGLTNGMVLAVPPPTTVPGVEEAITAALLEAQARGIAGKDITPFLLGRVTALTQGLSLTANIALVKKNAAVAASLAVAAMKRQEATGGGSSSNTSSSSSKAGGLGAKRHFSSQPSHPRTRPLHPSNGVPSTGLSALCVGGALLDVLSRPLPGKPLTLGTSNPGVNTQSPGGVARNISEVIGRLAGSSGSGGGSGSEGEECGVVLITALGEDLPGFTLEASCRDAGVRVVRVKVQQEGNNTTPQFRTASYSALLDGKGELVAAVSDTAIIDHTLQPGAIASAMGGGMVEGARMVVCDANTPSPTLTSIASACAAQSPPTPFVFEPVSVAKCTRILDSLHLCTILKPNRFEVVALAEAWRARMGLPPLPTPPKAPQEGEGGKGVEEGLVISTPGMEEEEENEEGEEDGDALALDTRILAAAQTILAGMLRPGGVSTPLGGTSGSVSAAGAGAEASLYGGTVEGKKHLLVSLGPMGVLWLSCPPLASVAAADLAATLPFFSAAADPKVDFDFTLIPPPETKVVKVTGAGDTFLGCVVWALGVKGVPMGSALRYGLAGAKMALECEPESAGGGGIPKDISPSLLEKGLKEVTSDF